MKKGTVGYIKKRKRFQVLYTLLIVLVSLGLFFIGLSVTKTTKNIMTVIAVLGVLPGAKSLVTVIILLPYHSLEQTKADIFLNHCPEGSETYADLVFSSTERVMHLDFLCVLGTECIGYSKETGPVEKIETYFTETMRKRGISVHMKVITKESDFLKRLSALKPVETPMPAELREWIEAILV